MLFVLSSIGLYLGVISNLLYVIEVACLDLWSDL